MRRIQDNFSGIRALAVPFLLPEQEDHRRIKQVIKNQMSVCNLHMNTVIKAQKVAETVANFILFLKT